MKRNLTLDYFKLFLSFLIILIHLQPITGVWNSLGSYMISNGFTRFAVPCFFIINGFFLYPKIKDYGKFCKYLKRIIIIYTVWSFIYLGLIFGKSLDLLNLILLFLVGNGNLWYVAALIIGVVLYFFLIKISSNNIFLFITALVLFLCGYFIQHSLKIELINEFNNFQTLHVLRCKNGLFAALPFIILGGIIRSKMDFFMNISNNIIIFIISISFIVLTIESYFSYATYYSSDFYIALFVLSPSLIICVLKNSKTSKTSDFMGHLSQAVYFVHPFVLWIIFSVFSLSQFGSNKILYIPIVLFLCLLMSTGIIQLNKHLKIFL